MSHPVARGRAALLVILVAALLGAWCSPASAGATTTLRLGVFPNVTHASGLVAIESGLLQKKLGPKVNLDVKYFNAGPTAVTALFSGAVDATYIGPNPAINAFQQSQGQAVRIISGATSGGAFLVVKPTINSAADLKGKKVASPQLGNTQDVALRSWLKSNGLKTDPTGGGDVTVLPQANAQTLDSFKQGLIDGAWVPEPWATRLVNEGGGKVLVDERKLWPDGKYVTTHLVAATSFLQSNSKIVKHLIEAQVEADDMLHKQRAQSERLVIQAIKKATGEVLDPGLVTASFDNLAFTNDPIASSLHKSAEDTVALGLLQPVDLKGIYDVTILNKVLEARGDAPVSVSFDTKVSKKK